MTLVRGRDRTESLSLRADAVVVGSGAGGAVVARELARAGLSVVVVEEGGHYAPSEYASFSPARSIGTLMREAGLAVALSLSETPVMSVLAGRCVGGSSVLTGGVCFRIPEAVRAEWEHDHGLRSVTEAALTPLYEALEADLGVETVPEAMRSRSTELFVEGAARMGVPMKSLRRNTQGCKGAARCNFGCPNGAKKSVDVVMLPEVLARSGTLLSDALVERVIVEGGVARGVRGRFLRSADGEPDVPFEIRAERVVVACGSLHTPMLLSRSGIRSPHLGRHMTLHPSFRVGALFDEDVQGWDGAMQSVYSDHFQDDGITLVGAYTAPSVLAAAFPGVGRAHRRLTAALPRLAFFGAMIHDEAAGRVRSFFGREPLITYAMTARDRERMWRGIGILAELAFAAGAREVLLPIFGQDPIASSAELAQLLRARPSARRVEAMSFHPLGTARMGADAARGVVSESGETFQVENLFVADGSVLPTSLGVNSQLPIMTMALKIGRGIAQGAGRGRNAA